MLKRMMGMLKAILLLHIVIVSIETGYIKPDDDDAELKPSRSPLITVSSTGEH